MSPREFTLNGLWEQYVAASGLDKRYLSDEEILAARSLFSAGYASGAVSIQMGAVVDIDGDCNAFNRITQQMHADEIPVALV